MPSRRTVTVLLSAALLAGATTGVGAARTNVELWAFLDPAPPAVADPPSATPSSTARPSRSPSASPTPTPVPTRTTSPRPSTSATPKPSKTPTPDPAPDPVPSEPAKPKAPTEFEEVSFGSDQVVVDVPKGWDAIEKSATWRDFRHPTGSLNLRIRIEPEGFGMDDEEAVRNQARIRSKLKGFTSYGITSFPIPVTLPDGTETEELGYLFRYSYTEAGGTRYATERYVEGGRAMIGAFGWYDQVDLVEPAALRAVDTLQLIEVG